MGTQESLNKTQTYGIFCKTVYLVKTFISFSSRYAINKFLTIDDFETLFLEA